jgi:hypothetical protein
MTQSRTQVLTQISHAFYYKNQPHHFLNHTLKSNPFEGRNSEKKIV